MAMHGFPAAGGSGEMAGYLPSKVKRKDLEDVYDDFSEFSLSSPARKIRRLDAELTPIMEEEEEPAVPHVFGQPLPKEQLQSSSHELAHGFGEVEPSPILNEERAIVLYKPVNTPLLDCPSSSNILLQVDPDVIAGFKNQRFWPGQHNREDETRGDEGRASGDDRQAASSSCLAVVPWVPSPPSGAVFPIGVPGGVSEISEDAMASEDVEAASMDVEEEGGRPSGATAPGMAVTEGFQHWQQQHCMTPQISPSTSAPIMWSWG